MTTTSVSTDSVVPSIRAQLFGSARIWQGEREIPLAAWVRPPERSLCLLLLATSGHSLPRERAVKLLWPAVSETTGHNALAKALHALRRVLEPDLAVGRDSAYLRTGGGTIGFRPGIGLAVDVDAFEALLAAAARQLPVDRRSPLHQALALYRGDLLADELYADWPAARRETLHRAWVGAAIELAKLALAAGAPRDALDALESLVAAEPTSEDAQLLLMRLYAASGQPERAIRQYRRCQRALRTALDAEPGPVLAEYAATLATAIAATAPSVPQLPLPLPPLPIPPTPLIGRDREVEGIIDLLADPACRLVTLTGSPGVGKTRLATEVARTTEDFRDGVAVLRFAAVRDPELVLPAIAHALGAAETAATDPLAAISSLVGTRQILLLLDNFEHILPAAADLAGLLDRCPRLTLLVTSRTPLHISGEEIVTVVPLSCPPAGKAVTHRLLLRYPAAALFLDRFSAVRPDSALSADADVEAASIVAAICRRLDGLPLAIELAAARGRHLSLGALLAHLDRRLELLTGGPYDLPPHQRTLRAALAWSYDALSPLEQIVFRRVAICAGGFSEELATCLMRDREAGPTTPAAVRSALARLIEHNLLLAEPGEPEPRFDMLETMREFGLEHLTASGETAATRAAHAAYLMDLAERLRPPDWTTPPAASLDRLELEHANLREAFVWLLAQGDGTTALRLCFAMRQLWRIRGYASEGVDWLARALSLVDERHRLERGRALYELGDFVSDLGDFDRATVCLEQALAIWRELGDHERIGRTLSNLGQVAMLRGNLHRARTLLDEAVLVIRTVENQLDLAIALSALGGAEIYLHDYPAAEGHFEEAIALFRALDDASRLNTALSNLGVLAMWQGDLPRARCCFEESLNLSRKIGDRRGIADIFANMSSVDALQGDLDRAVTAGYEALQIYREIENQRCTALMLASLADMVHQQGDDERALGHMRQAITYLQQMHDQPALLECVEVATRLQPFCHDPAHCTRLLGAAAAQREQVGIPREPPNQADYDKFLSALQAALGPDAFVAAWQSGQSLTLAEAVTIILDDVTDAIPLQVRHPAYETAQMAPAGPPPRV